MGPTFRIQTYIIWQAWPRFAHRRLDPRTACDEYRPLIGGAADHYMPYIWLNVGPVRSYYAARVRRRGRLAALGRVRRPASCPWLDTARIYVGYTASTHLI